MEKGFNDDELADIMSEIENLEQEFAEGSAEVAPVEAVQESSEDVSKEVSAEMDAAAVELEQLEAELADIEIAEPQEELVAEVVEEPVAEITEEVFTEGPVAEAVELDIEMKEVVNELASMPVEDITGDEVESHDDNVHHMHKVPTQGPETSTPKTGHGHSSMSFNVEGDMKLDLSFNISGKNVSLNISEEGFELELEGGVKFSIPLNEVDASKKAA